MIDAMLQTLARSSLLERHRDANVVRHCHRLLPPMRSPSDVLQMTSLLDQSALTDARRTAGRGRAPRRRRRGRRRRACARVSLGRRARRRGRRDPSAPKATMSACASWSAAGRRWSRPTTSGATARRRSPSARSRWRASRPRIRMPGLADRDLLARQISRSRSARSRPAVGRRISKSLRAPPRRPALAVQGRHQVRRRLRVGRHRRHGAGDEPRLSRRLSRLAPRRLDDGDRRRRHRRWSATTISPPRCTRAISTTPRTIGRTAGERAVKRLNPRKVATRRVPVVFDPRVAGSLIGHLAARDQRRAIARKTSFLKDKHGRAVCSRRAFASSTIRCGRAACARSPFDGEGVAGRALAAGRGRRADVLDSRLRDRARARPRRPPAMRSAASPRRPRPAPPICISSRARRRPRR